MPVSVAFIKELENIDPQLRRVLINLLEEIERQREESVTKKEFNELKEIVRDLGNAIKELTEAQKRTEARVEELAEAQKRTEKRLEEFEKRTSEEFGKVWQAIKELTEAQKRTKKRLEEFEKRTSEEFGKVWQAIKELTEAQKRTEARVEELAEAQKRTEEEIAALVKRMDAFERRLSKVEERLEGISNSVGYSLENKAYRALPGLLAERFGLKVKDRLLRRYVKIGQKDIQINIYGLAYRNGDEFLVLGECKVRPSKKEIERFTKYAVRIAEEEGKKGLLVLVAHDFPPRIEEFLKEKDIAYFWSYELE